MESFNYRCKEAVESCHTTLSKFDGAKVQPKANVLTPSTDHSTWG